MTQFDQRRDAFETRFAHDETLRFKATARRNRIVGLWAAAELGKAGEEAEAYARSVVAADFQEAGDGDVIRKLTGDLEAAGRGVPAAEVERRLAEAMAQATAEIRQQAA